MTTRLDIGIRTTWVKAPPPALRGVTKSSGVHYMRQSGAADMTA